MEGDGERAHLVTFQCLPAVLAVLTGEVLVDRRLTNVMPIYKKSQVEHSGNYKSQPNISACGGTWSRSS